MATELQPAHPAQPTRRLTVDEVIQMAEAGIIRETERVELLDGRLVEMSPEGSNHAGVVAEITTLLARIYPHPYRLRSQSTLPTGRYSYLEPDVFVVNHHDLTTFPGPSDTVLVIETAKTSVTWDCGGKARLSAQWGAAVYWVVDLTHNEVVVHTDPMDGVYRTIRTYQPGDQIPLPALATTLSVQDILIPR